MDTRYVFCVGNPPVVQRKCAYQYGIRLTGPWIETGHLECSSDKLILGRYLRNAVSMGWVFAWRWFVTRRLLSLQKHYHLHDSDFATSKCFGGRYIWDCIFSLTSSAP